MYTGMTKVILSSTISLCQLLIVIFASWKLSTGM